MLARTINKGDNGKRLEQIALTADTGIQMTDYEIEVDWSSKDSLIQKARIGYFMSRGTDEPYTRLKPDDGEEVVFRDEQEREIAPEDTAAQLQTVQSLQLYDGVWFPVPYFAVRGQTAILGPRTWARCRIVDITERAAAEKAEQMKRSGEKVKSEAEIEAELTPLERLKRRQDKSGGGPRLYHVTLAFDTTVDEGDAGAVYYQPTERDINAGTNFKLTESIVEQTAFLKPQADGTAWVKEWAQAVFMQLARERLPAFTRMRTEDVKNQMLAEHLDEQHYLNLLGFLQLLVKPKNIRLLAYSGQRCVDVSLVLDIGNSRSCGILVEHHQDSGVTDDDFSSTAKLVLRDLTAPENEYDHPFVSRLEFAKPQFDFDGKSARSKNLSAFTWPSLVRVGTEAANLSALMQGYEGATGLTSPKRYLWKNKGEDDDVWFFNNMSYQIKSPALTDKARTLNKEPAFKLPYCSFINAYGQALFTEPENTLCLQSGYSYRSLMTMMLNEIFLQALVQMNSAAHRYSKRDAETPRRLSAVILTVPPAMAQEERENLRSCVYEALGILWKCLGYDKSAPEIFALTAGTELSLPLPDVRIDWNEAEAGQVVYLYNEIQKVFGGQGRSFLQHLIRPHMQHRFNNHDADAQGNPLISARIASLDIGGGTSDLVIRDYTFPEGAAEHESDIRPYEVLSTGLSTAGDDLLLDLIKAGPLQAVRMAVDAAGRHDGLTTVNNIFANSAGNIEHQVLRLHLVDQLFSKVALRLMFHLEHFVEQADQDVTVSGTLHDFLQGTETLDDLPLEWQLNAPAPYPEPNQAAVSWAEQSMDKFLPGFKLLNTPLTFNLSDFDRRIRAGRTSLTAALHELCALINQYEPDVVLLTGRPSQLPAIRGYFEQRLGLSPQRIISMHSYECPWYPFRQDGIHIGDPKTTAAVGALLSHMRSDHTNFPNFRYQAQPQPPLNQMHYIGILNDDSRIPQDGVIELFYSASEVEIFNRPEGEPFAAAMAASRLVAFNLDAGAGLDPRQNEAEQLAEGKTIQLKLAANFGYRQFGSPLSQAHPLYRLELIDSIEDTRTMKEARRLCADKSISELSNSEVMNLADLMAGQTAAISPAIEQLVNDLKQACQDLDSCQERMQNPPSAVLTPEMQAQLQQQAEAQVETMKFGLFGGRKKKDALAEILQQLQAAKLQELSAAAAGQAAGDYDRLQGARTVAFNQLYTAYLAAKRSRLNRTFDKARAACNENRNAFTLKFAIACITHSEDKDHPYPYLKRVLKDKLPPVVKFKIKELKLADSDAAGNGLEEFFVFNLKTVSDNVYWTQSGVIKL